jgi:hypothetical protein
MKLLITSSLLDPNILFGTLLSNIINLSFYLKVSTIIVYIQCDSNLQYNT